MNLRDAGPDDVPLILELIRGLADYEKLLDQVEATEERLRATLFPAAGSPAAGCILAFEEGASAGFALHFQTYSTFLARPGMYLEDIYVRPEFRGRGIGRAMFTHLARLANARGCGRLEWSVLDWNKPAINFYESMGARRMEEWTTCRLAGDALARLA